MRSFHHKHQQASRMQTGCWCKKKHFKSVFKLIKA